MRWQTTLRGASRLSCDCHQSRRFSHSIATPARPGDGSDFSREEDDTPLTGLLGVHPIFGLDPRYYRRRDSRIEPLGSRPAKVSSRGSR
jgi:hypothetical protein